MTADNISKIVIAVLAVVSALVGTSTLRGRNGRRDLIKRDLELWGLLPEGDAKKRLGKHIETNVSNLIEEEQEKRRNASEVVLGMIFIAMTGGFCYLAASDGGYWYLVLAPALLTFSIGIAGFAMGLTKAKRDAKGNRLKE